MSLQLPLALEAESGKSLQAQIFDQIRSMILDGRLGHGDALPASRLLSHQMGVSRNTTILAYERLMSEGYIETRPSVGTFVSATLPDKALRSENSPPDEMDGKFGNRPLVQFSGRVQSVFNPHGPRLDQDFWVGRPDADTFPKRAWRRLVCEQISNLGTRLTAYDVPEGYQPLREAIAKYLGHARGIATTEDQVIIVGGSQDGLNLIARLLLGPDTLVTLEQPCYQGAAYVFESFDADIRPIPVDAHGLQVELLEGVSNAIVYVTPSHQYPTGVMLTPERRRRLLDWAAATGSSIIEDDYDSDFRYDGSPLTALKGLDSEGNVIYLGTFSKSIGAGIRLGYLVVPELLVEPARRLKGLMNNGQPTLEQAILAEFMKQDGYSRHLRTIRQIYKRRRDCLIASLERHFGDVELIGVDGGMHLAWRLPESFPSPETVEAIALSRKVGIYSLRSGAAEEFSRTDFCKEDFSRRLMVLGYAALKEEEIACGIERLARGLAEFSGASQ